MSGENEPVAFMQNNFRFTLVTPTEVRIKHIDKQFLGLFWEVTPEIFSYNTYTLSLLFLLLPDPLWKQPSKRLPRIHRDKYISRRWTFKCFRIRLCARTTSLMHRSLFHIFCFRLNVHSETTVVNNLVKWDTRAFRARWAHLTWRQTISHAMKSFANNV